MDDPYKSGPRSSWRFCDFPNDSSDSDADDDKVVHLQSYLGILHLTEVTGSGGGSLKYRIRVTAVKDHDTNLKVIQLTQGARNGNNASPGASSASSKGVAVVPYSRRGQYGREGEGGHSGQVCDSNLCFNGGHCDPIGRSPDCVCKGHFIGKFAELQFAKIKTQFVVIRSALLANDLRSEPVSQRRGVPTDFRLSPLLLPPRL